MIRVAASEVPNAGSFADALMLAAAKAPRLPQSASTKVRALTEDEKATVRRLYYSNVWNATALAREFRVTVPQIQECLR